MNDYTVVLTEEQRQVLLDLVRTEVVAGSVNHDTNILNELDKLLD